MLNSDADILLAISHTRQQLTEQTDILCRHVYGHQDTRCPKQSNLRSIDSDEDSEFGMGLEEDSDAPHTVETRKSEKMKLLTSVRVNIECDRIATETVEVASRGGNPPNMPQVLSLPYT